MIPELVITISGIRTYPARCQRPLQIYESTSIGQAARISPVRTCQGAFRYYAGFLGRFLDREEM